MAVARPAQSVPHAASPDPDSGAGGTRREALLPDVALAAALTAFAQLDVRLDLDNSTRYGPQWAVILCSLVATSALVFRRRAPLATMLAVAAAVAGPQLVTILTFTLWGHFLPLLVAAYSAPRHAAQARPAAGTRPAVTALVVLLLRVPVLGTAANVPFGFLPLVVVMGVGRGLRRRDRS